MLLALCCATKEVKKEDTRERERERESNSAPIMAKLARALKQR